ncbi:bifunctional tetrahydrofolate synthase/dihydrofolate synthase [Mergibacter septicus]|uniref:bifunctional tetrahydrofolate synthase/dihydrofolate synthase n=1 Tax=Mergibacter septicus TaxID=221402 RepID=UPI001178D2DA|nr:bifunctional tetrahydrofolate synthase/dihydrofolate synthase [Mergibacter septicus]AWX13120.1 bifunctional tetrahydrofolate synthase/dihydrofolate synthase [Mergibacter septicus]
MRIPTATSTLSEWLNYLEQAHFKPIDMGLERVKSVAERLDLQSPAPYVITVAGTNGKGTTCYLLETTLRLAGFNVGVFSSPHLIRYNERIRINQQEVDDQMICQAFDLINQHKSVSLTYFEFSTLSALYLFKQAKLDIVILEVGLGGRLDATNLVAPNFAVITSIDIDHIAFLGNDREKIGAEKAGICRPNIPLVVGEPHCPLSIKKIAQQLNCQTLFSGIDFNYALEADEAHWQWQGTLYTDKNSAVLLNQLPIGSIPLQNAATALAVLKNLPFSIPDQIIQSALANAKLTGRFQRLSQTEIANLASRLGITKSVVDLPQIILDVGHNPHAARYLAQRLATTPRARLIAICGILEDKDCAGVFTPLFQEVDQWYLIPLAGERGQSAKVLLEKLHYTANQQQCVISAQAKSTMQAAVTAGLYDLSAQDILLIFGSFHTVSDFMQL